MTVDEASEQYQIPIEIMKEYESWGLCSSVKNVIAEWQTDDQDQERKSLIMTHHDNGS